MPSSYAIGGHFEQFIRQQIESGRYASASEVVREALRLLEGRERLRHWSTRPVGNRHVVKTTEFKEATSVDGGKVGGNVAMHATNGE